MPDVLIVAAEPSGDALAGELVRAAGELRPDVRFFGVTGPELESAGAERVLPTSTLSTMGLTEVAGKLPAALKALSTLARAAVERPAMGAVLVDAPDFNLRLAGRLARRGVPVVQYVAPTVWAWRRGRIRAVRRYVRRLLVTLPFEAEAYVEAGVDAVYVGHPAADRVPRSLPPRSEVATRAGLPPALRWVALLPGSRDAELERLGGPFAAAAAWIAARVPDAAFLTPVAPGVDAERVAGVLAGAAPVALVQEGRHEVLAHCAAAITASGTASLELALLGVPHVVAYRVSAATWGAARLLVRVEHVALPNLIAGKKIVPEFLQGAVRPAALAGPVLTWLADEAARAEVVSELDHVRDAVGPPGVAGRAARETLEALDLAL
ncbi:MAG TPA: lipid-A-disaccharide synthase [Gemmatimonadota bacterium]|nr:lipid-A-disaccharide synthase [Gemmatimonadota bacterium]